MPSRVLQVPRPQAHLFWPPTLVVDLDQAVLAGWDPVTASEDLDLSQLALSRPALDLIRLQKRFRGRLMCVSTARQDIAGWIATLLGLERGLLHAAPMSGLDGRVLTLEEHLEPRGFDLLAGPAMMARLGGNARRGWLLGQSDRLQRQLLTQGCHLYQLDPEARVPLRALVVPGRGWQVGADAVAHEKRRAG